MELAEKLRRLRQAEGIRRGLWRTYTQQEVARAMRQEIGVSISQAYLSQLESGARVHLTSATREALARFYHVHPGYLVSDPPGMAALPDAAAPLDANLLEGVLTRLAEAPDAERVLRLLDALLRLPPATLAALERQAGAPGAASDIPDTPHSH